MIEAATELYCFSISFPARKNELNAINSETAKASKINVPIPHVESLSLYPFIAINIVAKTTTPNAMHNLNVMNNETSFTATCHLSRSNRPRRLTMFL